MYNNISLGFGLNIILFSQAMHPNTKKQERVLYIANRFTYIWLNLEICLASSFKSQRHENHVNQDFVHGAVIHSSVLYVTREGSQNDNQVKKACLSYLIFVKNQMFIPYKQLSLHCNKSWQACSICYWFTMHEQLKKEKWHCKKYN